MRTKPSMELPSIMIWLSSGPFDLRGGDGYVFHLSENVCELHTDELGIFLRHPPDDVLLGVVTHEPDSFPMVTVYGRGAPLREKF